MIIRLADNLNMETELPIKNVINFWYSWKTGCHAMLHLEGFIDRSSKWNFCQSYNSQLRLWINQDTGQQTIFSGIIAHIETKMEGNLEHIMIKVLSASCLLDRKSYSCSFQNIKKTYGEIVREEAESEGGQIIRNRESDKEIGIPIIRYKETVWQFAGRLANRLGTCIIPDVVTGRPNFWFGMRKGKEVFDLSEEYYTMEILPIGKVTGIRYQTEGRILCSIGDTVSYLKQTLTITGVEGYYEHGELVFKYMLEDMRSRIVYKNKHASAAGLGLWGTVLEVKGESLKIALDIDDNKETGDYYYPWQPETGNSLYAMPEPGTKALLYFYDADQMHSSVIHCLNKEDHSPYKDRFLDIIDGNKIYLWEDKVSLSKGEKHMLTIGGSSISAGTQKKMEISAEGGIFLRGRKIALSTPEELVISQA